MLNFTFPQHKTHTAAAFPLERADIILRHALPNIKECTKDTQKIPKSSGYMNSSKIKNLRTSACCSHAQSKVARWLESMKTLSNESSWVRLEDETISLWVLPPTPICTVYINILAAQSRNAVKDMDQRMAITSILSQRNPMKYHYTDNKSKSDTPACSGTYFNMPCTIQRGGPV